MPTEHDDGQIGSTAGSMNLDEAVAMIREQAHNPPDTVHALASKVIAARILPHQAALSVALGSDVHAHVLLSGKGDRFGLLCLDVESDGETRRSLFGHALVCAQISLTMAAFLAKQGGSTRAETFSIIRDFVEHFLERLPVEEAGE